MNVAIFWIILIWSSVAGRNGPVNVKHVDVCAMRELDISQLDNVVKLNIPDDLKFLLISFEEHEYYAIDRDYHSPELKTFPQEWQFNPERLVGRQWRNGQPFQGKVFGKDGTYQFYFSDNLHTEPENSMNCTLFVNFTSKAK